MTEMPQRQLGRTGLQVGVIGLGTEYLRYDRQVAIDTIREALDRGVNYFDVLMPMPEYRDSMGAAFNGQRERAILTCHLGGIVERGQWGMSRDPSVCEPYVEDWLRRLGTDYVDVLNITCVDRADDFERIMAPGGVMELAERLVREGKARFVGLSGHEPSIAARALASGKFDVLTQGCNVKWPIGPTGQACAKAGVGLVAMKPYAGGEIFHPPYSDFITTVLAISYVLAQPGICAVIPGAANVPQLNDALAYLEARPEERDFTQIMANFAERIWGTCTFCNHCLPCPMEIPVGDVMNAYRGLGWGLSYAPDLARGLADKPGLCTGCGECVERCPFGVDVPAEMSRAAKAFAELKV